MVPLHNALIANEHSMLAIPRDTRRERMYISSAAWKFLAEILRRMKPREQHRIMKFETDDSNSIRNQMAMLVDYAIGQNQEVQS